MFAVHEHKFIVGEHIFHDRELVFKGLEHKIFLVVKYNMSSSKIKYVYLRPLTYVNKLKLLSPLYE